MISQSGETKEFAITVTKKIIIQAFQFIAHNFLSFISRKTLEIIALVPLASSSHSLSIRLSTIQSVRPSTSSFFFPKWQELRNDLRVARMSSFVACLPVSNLSIPTEIFPYLALTMFATRSFYEIPSAFRMHIFIYFHYILILKFLFL